MISLRKAVATTHRWTGLTLGLFAVVMAVTGAGLALRPVLAELGQSAGAEPAACAVTVPLDRQVADARAADPATGIALTRLDLGAGEPTVVRFSDDQAVSVDPCTGAVLAAKPRFAGLFGRLEQLHRLAYWRNGAASKLVKGSAALMLVFATVAGGLFLWWPRHRNGWRRALAVDPKLRGRAFALNLHRVTGASTSLVIFAVALTGVPIAFDWAKQGLYVLTASQPPAAEFAAAAPEAGAGRIPLETAWRQLQAFVPAPDSAVFRYPQKPGEPIEIDAVGRDAPHGDARSSLFLDAASGTVLSFQPYAGLSRGRKLYYWMLALHTGRAGGWPVDLILFVGMLGVPVMAYTGIDSWLRSRRRKRQTAVRPARSADPA